MKKQYLPPEMMQVPFVAADILTVSPAASGFGDIIDWSQKAQKL